MILFILLLQGVSCSLSDKSFFGLLYFLSYLKTNQHSAFAEIKTDLLEQQKRAALVEPDELAKGQLRK